MNKPDGGPAFPAVDSPRVISGMSLRDWFAGHAQESDLILPLDTKNAAAQLGMSVEEYSKDFHNWLTINARARYRFADAMIAERERQP